MIFDIIKQVWLELSNRVGYKTELPLDDVNKGNNKITELRTI